LVGGSPCSRKNMQQMDMSQSVTSYAWDELTDSDNIDNLVPQRIL
jgi:hypothetical protein